MVLDWPQCSNSLRHVPSAQAEDAVSEAFDKGPLAQASAAPGIISADEMRRRERENIRAALKRARWKVYGAGGAAELLGMKPTTLTSRLKKMGLKRPPNAEPDSTD